MKINCINDKNNEFMFERNVFNCCLQDFELNENEVFQVSSFDFVGDEEEQFYTICPNCGYIILLSDEMISEEVKDMAREKSENIPLLFKINNATSELINLKNRSNKIARVRRL